jgi:colicin import membrane protein
MMNAQNDEIFFYYSLILHGILFAIFVVSFHFAQPMPVLKNSNQIIEARVFEEPKKPTKVIQDPLPAPKSQVPPVVKKTQSIPPKEIQPLVKKEAIAIPDKKVKEVKKPKDDLIQKQLLADLEKQKKQKLAEKKKQKAIEDALAKEMRDLNEKRIRDDILKAQKQVAEARAAEMQGIVDKYKALILQAISQNWLIPGGVNKKLSAVLLIHLAPGGTVLDVQLTRSSGDVALDRSALAAVLKASPLPVPTVSEEFEPFRQFVLKVKPESILALSS